ncbi:hypothetical protein STRATTON_271 [Erwinia phage vB_EamM_Stratton]|uniref:Uncharacterized protein n=2 Tax=Erskinevirus EaH2 TaxID=2169883 RepID=A0A1B2IHF1_9CAUD|nr:hypothetical protein G173_gp169 [Erwinia phage phiEaH2]AFQ96714.1 hypothetical protein [Erwinia phage phiEaH2]ANZ50696.1 hypothetical protein STRATTON_271 [Erwinia phage vB_EamM_Stratton]
MQVHPNIVKQCEDPFTMMLVASKCQDKNFEEFMNNPAAVQASVLHHLERIETGKMVKDVGEEPFVVKMINHIASPEFRAIRLERDGMPNKIRDLFTRILNDRQFKHVMDREPDVYEDIKRHMEETMYVFTH